MPPLDKITTYRTESDLIHNIIAISYNATLKNDIDCRVATRLARFRGGAKGKKVRETEDMGMGADKGWEESGRSRFGGKSVPRTRDLFCVEWYVKPYAQFTPPARYDKTVLSVSCLAWRCELAFRLHLSPRYSADNHS